MALNPTASGESHNWNYTKPENPGFNLSLVGTVVAIQEVQAMNFGNDGRPSTPKFWENSAQPMMNIRLVLCGPSGGYRTWTIQPAGKAAKEGKKKSVHLDLFALAGGKSMLDLIGKTISVTTQAPPAGFSYGIGNPRPWLVSLVTDQGPYELKEPLEPVYLMPVVLGNGAVSGGAVNAPQPVTQPAPPMPDNVSAMPGPAPEAAAAFPDDVPF